MLQELCNSEANRAPNNKGWSSYGPSPNQLLFFTLVWLLKQTIVFSRPQDLFEGLDDAALQARVARVTKHLDLWGLPVTDLRNGEDKEWELLRIQVSQAIEQTARKYQSAPRRNLQEDALGKCIIKILALLRKMPPAAVIESTNDVWTFTLAEKKNLTNIYDFGSPFYPFARRIAHNELISALRTETRHRNRALDLEQLEASASDHEATMEAFTDPEVAYEVARREFRANLERLFEAIQNELPPKPKQVVLYSLAMRPQLWRALREVEASIPAYLPQPSTSRDDRSLADMLQMRENNIRVHRNHARKRIAAIDPELGLLLTRLMARHPR